MRQGLILLGVFFACLGCAGVPPREGLAQPLSVSFKNTVALPTTTTDQSGNSFTITGLSGITYIGGEQYIAVMDNSNKLVRLRVALSPTGAIASTQVLGGITLAATHDYEAIAPGGHGTVLLAEEDTPAIREFRLVDGVLVRTITPPAIFAQRRANFGFESLTSDGTFAWAANEEALTSDGPLSTATQGTTVRLLRIPVIPGQAAATPASTWPQFAYRSQPWHGSAVGSARSGVSELVMLPGGTLLTLERSFAFNLAGFFQCRIYEIGFAAATDVRGFTAGLTGQTYTTTTKRLLWSGSNVNNMEGLALGPRLDPARPGSPRGTSYALIGIVDDGDPISVNTLASFVVSGVVPTSTATSPQVAGVDEAAGQLPRSLIRR
jgi:hypothetical protein